MNDTDRASLILAHTNLVRAEVRRAGITNRDDADDAFQNGCVALLTAFDQWQGRSTFGTYARSAVRRAVVDCARLAKRGPLAGIRNLPRAGGVVAMELDGPDVNDYDADFDDDDRPASLAGRLTDRGLVDKSNSHSVASDIEDQMIVKLDYESLIQRKPARRAYTNYRGNSGPSQDVN